MTPVRRASFLFLAENIADVHLVAVTAVHVIAYHGFRRLSTCYSSKTMK